MARILKIGYWKEEIYNIKTSTKTSKTEYLFSCLSKISNAYKPRQKKWYGPLKYNATEIMIFLFFYTTQTTRKVNIPNTHKRF